MNSTPNTKKLIKIAESLIIDDLLNLLKGEILVLRIPNYYPLKEAAVISEKMIQQESLQRYHRAPDVGVKRTGITFFETNGSLDMLERYYQEAPVLISQLRQVCSPYLSPIDKLRLELADIWLVGASIENVHNRRMLAGIARAFEHGFELPPHQDILYRDILDSPIPSIDIFENLTTQLSSNIYLRTPETGGELEVWDLKPSWLDQQSIRDQEYKYEGIIDRSSLPPAKVVIKPEVGELILFDSGCVHAVCASSGSRVSMSMFIGYRSQNKPLTYWS
jgi:2OG-Fe(II) oxygenase superfamily